MYAIRSYYVIFRGRDHLDRLKYSADVYRMPIPYSLDELVITSYSIHYTKLYEKPESS